ncbi:aminotransferase class IV family protein [[Pseudomonas] boreopolis]|uniref:aminotransferase class IV family protein n=1 Tax=Xanthomonas boreopolis TaxID=86183 RepID=UPI003DA1C0B3
MNLVLHRGAPAGADVLAALALVNYGHFTSLQVRDGAVRGLDLHLQRLQQGTSTLFRSRLDEERLRVELAAALDAFGRADASLRVTVFSPDFDFREPLREAAPEVLVSLSPASQLPAAPLRVRPVAFVRELPQVKHVGTFPLFQLRRDAMEAGFDDALFVDARGCLVEGSVWNLGLWDGQGITWPEGPALRGTQERLLRAGLALLGVPQRVRPVRLDETGAFRAAFACNSRGLQPIRTIGESAFPELGLPPVLERALSTQPWQPLR